MPDGSSNHFTDEELALARLAVKRNWQDREKGSPVYTVTIHALAAVLRRLGTDRFALYYNLRQPVDQMEEWSRDFFQGRITETNFRERILADVNRQLDLDMVTRYSQYALQQVELYSAVLQILSHTDDDEERRVNDEWQISAHIKAMNGKWPLWKEHLLAVVEFLEELRVELGHGLIRVGEFEGTFAHWTVMQVINNMTKAWESCRDISERSQSDPRYLYATSATFLFKKHWLHRFPRPQSLAEILREEYVLAKIAIRQKEMRAASTQDRVQIQGVPKPAESIGSKPICEILFLSANPPGPDYLALDMEYREIEGKIRAAKHRDSVRLVAGWAVRPDDLLQKLNEHRPQVVHFSGHGSTSSEILLAHDVERGRTVCSEALEAVFQTFRESVRLVVLNACFSRSQAEAIAKYVDCAIGMGAAISDSSAIVFAASLYRAIGFGVSIQDAFDQGLTAMRLEGSQEHHIPKLFCKQQVDPATVYLLPMT